MGRMTSPMLTLRPFTKTPFPAGVDILPREWSSPNLLWLFYGDFAQQDCVRDSGLWKYPTWGGWGNTHQYRRREVEQFFNSPQSAFLSKGGIGYGIDETQTVEYYGK
mmetsp:Transcript_138524/g.276144  ORF Transcript_138524/g.276144 Transcript_138524/m.276144 type:complete len:107 (-) Transcript_138524:237-557(-)